MTSFVDPAQLLAALIRFDTSNPPGDEADCIKFIDKLFKEHEFTDRTIIEAAPGRSSLVVRLAGRGESRPLLMYGHIDVVTCDGQEWSHPPFAAHRENGFIWGRGAIDMKGGVAMMISALLQAAQKRLRPSGDVILAVLCDEEAGGNLGARFLVENRPGLFAGVRHAVGEFGGFSLHLAGNTFYPMMVAEKQACHILATFTGEGGHGAHPVSGQAMKRLSTFLSIIDGNSLPYRLTATTRLMIEKMSMKIPELSHLLSSDTYEQTIEGMGDRAKALRPLFHNTVSPTMLAGSSSVNVIPHEVRLHLDGRVLPGSSDRELLDELLALCPDELSRHLEFKVLDYSPWPRTDTDLSLLDLLGTILVNLDPAALPCPFMVAGSTDARHFARLGIQTYGFTPLKLPPGFDFEALVHAANERVTEDAVRFGTKAIGLLLERYR